MFAFDSGYGSCHRVAPEFTFAFEDAMATKADRGTKRTCQNGSCGSRFYDLNREPITCPMCSSTYVPVAVTPRLLAESRRAAVKKPEFVPPVLADDAPEAEDALVEVEGAEEPAVAGEEEAFLETEEDEGGDVSGIIGGGTPEGEEEG